MTTRVGCWHSSKGAYAQNSQSIPLLREWSLHIDRVTGTPAGYGTTLVVQ